MKRGGRLQRRTPLVARAPLVTRAPLRAVGGLLRRTPLAQVSKRRHAENHVRTGTVAALKAAQIAQFGYTFCERCIAKNVPLDCDERLSRARGGSITDPANMQLLCRPCHDWKHTHDVEAQAQGWSQSQYGGGAE